MREKRNEAAAKGGTLYLTINEAVAYTNLSRVEVLNRISAGRYITIVDGKRTKVFRASIDSDTLASLETRREAQRIERVA